MEQKKKKKKKKKKGSVRRLEETLLLNFMQQEKRSFIADQTETTSPCPCRGEDGGMGWPGTRDRLIQNSKWGKWFEPLKPRKHRIDPDHHQHLVLEDLGSSLAWRQRSSTVLFSSPHPPWRGGDAPATSR
ncbi:hypothetical protein OsJ_14153 [Oryza sativa Japonica Group]|uniref:Uncharacterized protein n=1 Tax=Oryza sativa subsp. japonica TaxID=39947 RepID=B9FE98_ORYSJ|nr:hypothetical protein OsJ_14153 [Oryza sativa Japonica Group]